jgi:PPOX class probable F420-dependent enzyme
MAAETELRELIASRREGVLGTIKRGGLPQLSNVLYLPEPGGRAVRISTTADRLKARVLARDPRAVLHVTGDNFWAYAVAEGHGTLTPAAADPGDAGRITPSTRSLNRAAPPWSPRCPTATGSVERPMAHWTYSVAAAMRMPTQARSSWLPAGIQPRTP